MNARLPPPIAVMLIGAVTAIAALACGVDACGKPVGEEIARYTYQDATYALVKYGDKLAVFADSGTPVTSRAQVDEILHSYAWSQTLDDFDTRRLATVADTVQDMDDSVTGVRDLSNDVVDALDKLDSIGTDVPLLGRVSALSVVLDHYPGLEDSEKLIRGLDAELNDLGDNARALSRAAKRIPSIDPSSVPGGEIDSLFAAAVAASRDMESSVKTVKGYVSRVRDATGGLALALMRASNTPVIGDAIRELVWIVERFKANLSDMATKMDVFESELGKLDKQMQDVLDATTEKHRGYMKRLLKEPHDAEWPPKDPDRRPAGAWNVSIDDSCLLI